VSIDGVKVLAIDEGYRIKMNMSALPLQMRKAFAKKMKRNGVCIHTDADGDWFVDENGVAYGNIEGRRKVLVCVNGEYVFSTLNDRKGCFEIRPDDVSADTWERLMRAHASGSLKERLDEQNRVYHMTILDS
jgi:hypothetical protein